MSAAALGAATLSGASMIALFPRPAALAPAAPWRRGVCLLVGNLAYHWREHARYTTLVMWMRHGPVCVAYSRHSRRVIADTLGVL